MSLSSVLDDFAEDPLGFFGAFLQFRDGRELKQFQPWDKQATIASAVVVERRIAVRSGHKLGKSKLAAALSIWWACTHHAAVVMVTAPTERQVKKALWKEVRQFWQNSPQLRLIMPEPQLSPETGSRWDDGRELFGFTAKSADAVSGPGGPEVFVVVDEAAGVPREVWEALQGVRAGGGKVFAIANPTNTSGWFFDAFNRARAGWKHFELSVLESPNFLAGTRVLPGLADRAFEEEIREDYGVDSPIYASRVLGDFPKAVGNAVLGLDLVEQARKLWDASDLDLDGATFDLGVDVAWYGDDDSVVSARCGLTLFSPAWFDRKEAREAGTAVKAVVNGYDAIKVSGVVLQCLKALPINGKKVRIKIDTTNGFGEGVVRVLRAMQELGELDPLIQIIEINFAGSSSDPEKYPVRRDELWFGPREWFRAGGAMFPDPQLENELIAATYSLDEKGRNKVEKKRDMKKRLGRSPDRADSALLALYEPPVVLDIGPAPPVVTYESPAAF